jgi:hypothetical protein
MYFSRRTNTKRHRDSNKDGRFFFLLTFFIPPPKKWFRYFDNFYIFFLLIFSTNYCKYTGIESSDCYINILSSRQRSMLSNIKVSPNWLITIRLKFCKTPPAVKDNTLEWKTTKTRTITKSNKSFTDTITV